MPGHRCWFSPQFKAGAVEVANPHRQLGTVAGLVGEGSLHIGQAADRAHARRETGATIDRMLSGLRSGARG
jgi:hypothetical protein